MARGGRRGRGTGRGKGRGTGGNTAGNGFSQSGGISRTFQGTNGAGSSASKPSAGGSNQATRGEVKGHGRTNSGASYLIREEVGDSALVKKAFTTRKGGVSASGKTASGGGLYDLKYPKTRGGQARGAGGSTQ